MTNLKASQLNEQAKRLNKKLTACRSIKRLLKQKGWRDIVQPLLEAMITDCIGGKEGNLYKKGWLGAPDGNYEYFTGYKQALMDFHNKIWNYPESIEILKNQIKILEQKAKGEDRYNVPMLDGRYAEQ